MNLEETLKNLESKYGQKQKEDVYKPSNHYISLTFQKGSMLENLFLADLDGIGFEKVLEGSRQTYYHSATFEYKEIENIQKLLKNKKNLLQKPYYDITYDYENVKYSDVINLGKANFTLSIYPDSDRKNNIEHNKKMEDYYSNLANFEQRLMTKDLFKNAFCSNMVNTVVANFDTRSLVPNFITEHPVQSLVNEIFDFTLKLCGSHIIDMHSTSHDHLYMLDHSIDNDNTEAKHIMNALRDKPDYKFYDALRAAISARYMGVEDIIPLHNYKDMKVLFPKEYDTTQVANEDGESIDYYLSRDFLIDRHVSPLNELTNLIAKTAIQYLQVNNAHDFHEKLIANNASSKEMATIVVEFFNNRVDWREWKTVLKDELVRSPCVPIVQIKRKNNKP